MKHIISFSGGKDSTALILWAKENLEEFTTVFCDTGWEHSYTYDYIEYINQTALNGGLITIKSAKYDGFADLSIKKGRVASAMARYCTQELKIFPMRDWLKTIKGEKTVYVGIRAAESAKRAKMAEESFDETYKCIVKRPLLSWTAEEVFAIMERHGVEPNPLYKMGLGRVGCMPCIMVNKKELREIINRFPAVIAKLVDLEYKVGRSFFPSGYIPDQFCTQKDKNGTPYPSVYDVVNYIKDKNLAPLFDGLDSFHEEERSCMSFYGLCE